jgi:ABC-2 type transport system ATP-binding protein
MSIQVQNVAKYYGTQAALNNVSFEINKGEIVGFIGPNGAGKSTMMKIITGYLPQTDGKVLVCGREVIVHPMEVKKSIGYLPEHNPLYLNMYVREYLEFVGGIYGLGNKLATRVSEMVSLTGLEPEQRKRIGALSKGYRQRVGLAAALVHDPEVLILDEPTSGLDPNQIIEIRNLILATGKQKTVMLSTHIMQEVEAICDRIIIVNKGQIVANENKHDIYQYAINRQTLLVEFGTAINADFFKDMQGVVQIKPLTGNNWLIETTTNTDIREEVFNTAVSNKVTVLSMQKKESNLEEVFRELTK